MQTGQRKKDFADGPYRRENPEFRRRFGARFHRHSVHLACASPASNVSIDLCRYEAQAHLR